MMRVEIDLGTDSKIAKIKKYVRYIEEHSNLFYDN